MVALVGVKVSVLGEMEMKPGPAQPLVLMVTMVVVRPRQLKLRSTSMP